jgi:hypothetical protein
MNLTEARCALLISILFGTLSVWATMRASEWEDIKQKGELESRISCDVLWYKKRPVLALRNHSSQRPVEILFLNMQSNFHAQKRMHRSASYDGVTILANGAEYHGFPSWANDNSTADISILFQWRSEDIHRVRVHTCDVIKRSNMGAKKLFSVIEEEDGWLQPQRNDGLHVPGGVRVRESREE